MQSRELGTHRASCDAGLDSSKYDSSKWGEKRARKASYQGNGVSQRKNGRTNGVQGTKEAKCQEETVGNKRTVTGQTSKGRGTGQFNESISVPDSPILQQAECGTAKGRNRPGGYDVA